MTAACASQVGPDLTVHVVVKGAQERHERQLVPADGRADWQRTQNAVGNSSRQLFLLARRVWQC